LVLSAKDEFKQELLDGASKLLIHFHEVKADLMADIISSAPSQTIADIVRASSDHAVKNLVINADKETVAAAISDADNDIVKQIVINVLNSNELTFRLIKSAPEAAGEILKNAKKHGKTPVIQAGMNYLVLNELFMQRLSQDSKN
jgi:flavoprotein